MQTQEQMEQVKAAAIMAALNAVDQKMHGQKVGVSQGPYAHGPNGLFSFVNGENPILSAMMRPEGLLGVLPIIRADQHVTDFVDTVTGVTDESGSEPADVCGTAVKAGLTKLGTLAVPLGRVKRRVDPISVVQLGKLKDRTEELGLMASYPASLMREDAWSPVGSAPTGGDGAFRMEMSKRMFELAVTFQRKLSQVIYTGDPSNNSGTPRDSGYKEYIGLDLWINAGNKRDARSSALLSSLNSLLLDFNYNNVASSSPSIVRYITQAWRYVNWNAQSMGLNPATWVFSMRVDLFNEITDIWPCSYLSHRCADGAGSNIVVLNDETNVRMRDEMRNGRFLWIDGVQVPVVLDTAITELNSSNENLNPSEYASDIYLIPMTVLGGMPVTGFQYFDQRISAGEAQRAFRDERVWATDNGLFLFNSEKTSLCLELEALTEPRLIMHTPQLAARIQNVKYVPLEHLRDAFPGDTYYLNGGNTGQAGEEFYNQWGSTPEQF